jgi:hypothetical protein
MFRVFCGFAIAIASLVALSSFAEATPDPAVSGYSCELLPEVKDALKRYSRAQKERDFVSSTIRRADELCREGKPEKARGYIELAHSRVLFGHKH